MEMPDTPRPTLSPLGNVALSSNGGMIELDTVSIIALALSVLVCCLCGFGVFGLFKYNALRREKLSEMMRYQSEEKQRVLSMSSTSKIKNGHNGHPGDGAQHKKSSTNSSWMIPGHQRYGGGMTGSIELVEGGGLLPETGPSAVVVPELEGDPLAKDTVNVNTNETGGALNLSSDDESSSTLDKALLPETAGGDRHIAEIENAVFHGRTAMAPELLTHPSDQDNVPRISSVLTDLEAIEHGDDAVIEDIDDAVLDDIDQTAAGRPVVLPHDEVTVAGVKMANALSLSAQDIVSSAGNGANDVDIDDLMEEHEGSMGRVMTIDDDGNEEPELLKDHSTIIDNEAAMRRKQLDDQERNQREFGQVLGDQLVGQGMVMDDIVEDIEAHHHPDAMMNAGDSPRATVPGGFEM